MSVTEEPGDLGTIKPDVTPGLTPEEEIDALCRELAALDETRLRVARRERQINEQIDRIRLAGRPTYPTPEQEVGLRAAAYAVKRGDVPTSHLGDPAIIGDYSVTVAGNRGAIYLNVNAWYSKARAGARLWALTEEEINRTLDLIRAEGLTVTDHWTHDHGLSVVAWPKA